MNDITQYLPEDIETDEKKGFVKRKGQAVRKPAKPDMRF